MDACQSRGQFSTTSYDSEIGFKNPGAENKIWHRSVSGRLVRKPTTPASEDRTCDIATNSIQDRGVSPLAASWKGRALRVLAGVKNYIAGVVSSFSYGCHAGAELILGSMALIVVTYGLEVFISPEVEDKPVNLAKATMPACSISELLYRVLIGPIAEEVLFQGILLKGINTCLKPVFPNSTLRNELSNVITALTFGFGHMLDDPNYSFFGASLSSLHAYFYGSMAQTHGLSSSIAAHAVWNSYGNLLRLPQCSKVSKPQCSQALLNIHTPFIPGLSKDALNALRQAQCERYGL